MFYNFSLEEDLSIQNNQNNLNSQQKLKWECKFHDDLAH
jgi:hypothetical protein